MKRIRSLGVIVALALALTAVVGVASASASVGFFSDEYPFTLKAEEPSKVHSLTFPDSEPFGEAQCAAPDLESGEGQYKAASLTIGGSGGGWYANCWEGGEVALQGCQLNWQLGEGASGDTVTLGGPGCTGAKVKANDYCNFEIPPQTLDADIELTTVAGHNALKLSVAAKGDMQYKAYGKLINYCSNGTSHSNGSWSGSWTAWGQNAIAEIVDLSTGGLTITGKESETPSEQPKFATPDYPAAIAGPQVSTDPLTFGFKDGITIDCESSTFSGTLSAASSSLGLGAASSGCVAHTSIGTINVTIKMNSCTYQMNLLNQGPPYAGTADIKCSKEGDKLEVAAGPCTFKLSPQQALAGIGFANSGTELGVVNADLGLEGIKYEALDGFGCPLKGGGTFSDGTYSGTSKLSVGF